MDSLSNYLPSMWKIREIKEKVTNVVMNYTDVEIKVREATNEEAWGPHGSLMQEIAQYTFTYEHYTEVMGMLWKRVFQDRENWRSIYKGLLLLVYLLKNGSEKVVTSAREHVYDLRGLESFSFIDENGKDQGVNIRIKAKEIIEFIQDDDRLREERKKAKKNKDKYVGIDSDHMTSSRSFHGGGGGMGSSDFRSSWSSSSSNRPTSDFQDTNSISNKINDISNKVKNMMDNKADGGYNNHEEGNMSDFSDGGNDNDFDPRGSSKNKRSQQQNDDDNSSGRERTSSGFDRNSSQENKAKPVNRIDPIKLKSTQIKKSPSQTASSSSQAVRSKTMGNIGDINKKNDLFGSKPEENENEFGDFVGYQGGNGGSGASQAQAQPKVQDLFDINDSITTTPVIPATQANQAAKVPDIDSIFSFPNPIPPSSNIVNMAPLTVNNTNATNNIQPIQPQPPKNPSNDLFDIFSNDIPKSFTMPNIQAMNSSIPANLLKPVGETSNTSIKPIKLDSKSSNGSAAVAENKTSTMWDALGQSVDINLDNLSRFSKGTKGNANSNIPMNQMMSPQSQQQQSNKAANNNLFNFSSPPMSPTHPSANSPVSKPPQPQPQPPSSNSANLLDF